MIPEERLLTLLQKLAQRSREGLVNWGYAESPPVRNSSVRAYGIVASSIRIEIAFVVPIADADYYCATIYGPDDEVLGRVSADDEERAEDADATLRALKNVFAEAERCVTGWDTIFNEIERKLDEGQPIGRRRDEPF